MPFASERQAIESQLTDNWTTTTIAYENVAFTPPNASEWIKLNILNGASGYRAIDSKERHRGAIVIQCFAPINTGTNTLRAHADALISIFQHQTFNNIVCGLASVAAAQPSDTAYQINVTIPYWRDE